MRLPFRGLVIHASGFVDKAQREFRLRVTMGLLDLDDDASSAKVGTFIRQWQVPDCCFHVDCGGMSVSLVSLRVSAFVAIIETCTPRTG